MHVHVYPPRLLLVQVAPFLQGLFNSHGRAILSLNMFNLFKNLSKNSTTRFKNNLRKKISSQNKV